MFWKKGRLHIKITFWSYWPCKTTHIHWALSRSHLFCLCVYVQEYLVSGLLLWSMVKSAAKLSQETTQTESAPYCPVCVLKYHLWECVVGVCVWVCILEDIHSITKGICVHGVASPATSCLSSIRPQFWIEFLQSFCHWWWHTQLSKTNLKSTIFATTQNGC